MILVYRVLSLILIIVTICLAYNDRTMAAVVVFLSALVSFVGSFITPKNTRNLNQTQSIGANSIGIQSGRDTNIEKD